VVKLARRRANLFMFPIMMGIIFFLSSCGQAAPSVGVSYTPPFAPITFTIDTSGTISVQGNLSIETPVGTFALEANVADTLQPEDNTLLLIIRHKQNGRVVDDAYKIQTRQDEVTVVTNGTTTIDVTQHKVFIDALKGDIKSIEVKDANSDNTSSTSESNMTPTVENVPTATPIPTSPPPAPTPLPYPVSKTGDVCQPPFSQFQATGWVPEKNSFVFTGNGSNVVISLCNVTTPNYAVTATIRLFTGQRGVGVVAHADSGGQAGYVGGSGCKNISFGACGFFINDFFADIMMIDQEDENLTGQTHTYKLVVNGGKLQLFYDNNARPIVTKYLATHPQAGYAGFECFDQCEVTGYTVTGI